MAVEKQKLLISSRELSLQTKVFVPFVGCLVNRQAKQQLSVNAISLVIQSLAISFSLPFKYSRLKTPKEQRYITPIQMSLNGNVLVWGSHQPLPYAALRNWHFCLLRPSEAVLNFCLLGDNLPLIVIIVLACASKHKLTRLWPFWAILFACLLHLRGLLFIKGR